MRKPKKKVLPRVTSVSVSRLYNLGNYQNVRYDLSAEVPKGASATEAFTELCYILAQLRPLSEPVAVAQYKAAIKIPETDRSAYQNENLKTWEGEYHEWLVQREARAKAIKSLDELGASITRKDPPPQIDSEDVIW